MDSVKKQIVFFRILMVVLSVLIISQFTFWIHQCSKESSVQNQSIQKITRTHLPSKAATPILETFWDLVKIIH